MDASFRPVNDVHDITPDELAHRVVYALMRPAVRLAAAFGLDMKTAATLLESAYFQELRSMGLTLDEASERLGVSRRTAARLSKQLKNRFVLPEIRHNLARRVEFMLAAQPMSSARLAQTLTDVEDADILTALDELVATGRVELRDGRTPTYHPASMLRQLARDTWVQRVGGLTSFAGNLADAVWGRFGEATPSAFARTLSFRVPKGSHERLEKFYEESLLPLILELDAEGEGDDRAPMQMSLCWAPYEWSREGAAAGEADSVVGAVDARLPHEKAAE